MANTERANNKIISEF